MQLDLFDARALAPLIGYLEHHGAKSETFLDRARIPAELIAAGGWVAKRQVYDFAYDIVERSGCPDAVFAAYANFQLDHLGPIADAMRACKTVKEALEVGVRLGRIAYEGSEYFLQVDGATTWFCFREPKVPSAGQQYVMDMTLATYHQLIRLAADEDWYPERILTQAKTLQRHRKAEHFADCQASYHPHLSALAFPTKYLRRRTPWSTNKPRADVQATWAFGPDDCAPLVEKLYRFLGSFFPHRNLPTLNQVALMLGVSPATLKRQLTATGTSYRGLLDRLRFDAACELLAIESMSIHDIARELGYSGANNFVRGFRRMTGSTPGRYREQLSSE